MLCLILRLLILSVLEAKVIRCWLPRKAWKQSFHGVPKVMVPSQSLTLREILSRFVRREPLPATKEGIYEERFGDIEKMSHLDIAEQMEVVADLKEKIKGFNEREKARVEKEASEKAQADKDAFEREVEARLMKAAREGKPAQNPAP